jgi:hypothetical protein
MNPLTTPLDQFAYAPARSFANLALIPLVRKHAPPPAYVTLDEALPTGRFRVTEVSEMGHVPELRVHNDLDTPVLLLDGEELVGAKQNRVVNLTILVPAHTVLTIPVSCVEAGRWHHVAPEFASSGRAYFREGRAHKQVQVSMSLDARGLAASDQGEVWNLISERAAALGTHSPTSAMHDIYESQRHHVEEYVRALGHVDGQVGAGFAIGGQFVGVEFFDASQTMSRLLAKIVGSYALDAVAAPKASRPAAFEPAVVRQWLGQVAELRAKVHPSVGLGEALCWNGPHLTAAALALDGGLVHFVGFPLGQANGRGTRGSQMRSASWRRARRAE